MEIHIPGKTVLMLRRGHSAARQQAVIYTIVNQMAWMGHNEFLSRI